MPMRDMRPSPTLLPKMGDALGAEVAERGHGEPGQLLIIVVTGVAAHQGQKKEHAGGGQNGVVHLEPGQAAQADFALGMGGIHVLVAGGEERDGAGKGVDEAIRVLGAQKAAAGRRVIVRIGLLDHGVGKVHGLPVELAVGADAAVCGGPLQLRELFGVGGQPDRAGGGHIHAHDGSMPALTRSSQAISRLPMRTDLGRRAGLKLAIWRRRSWSILSMRDFM